MTQFHTYMDVKLPPLDGEISAILRYRLLSTRLVLYVLLRRLITVSSIGVGCFPNGAELGNVP